MLLSSASLISSLLFPSEPLRRRSWPAHGADAAVLNARLFHLGRILRWCTEGGWAGSMKDWKGALVTQRSTIMHNGRLQRETEKGEEMFISEEQLVEEMRRKEKEIIHGYSTSQSAL